MAEEAEAPTIILKNAAEIDAMASAGALHSRVLGLIADLVAPGITTGALDRAVEELICAHGAAPTFKGYGGYPASICASINSTVVHGIPGPYRLRSGDILSVDVGVTLDGWVADGAFTFAVGEVAPAAQRLLVAGREALACGIERCQVGGHVGDISHAIQTHVESGGYTVIRGITGHGVGRSMHEDPDIPNHGHPGEGPRLVEGMVIAIEPMIAQWQPDWEQDSDGWTIRTLDGGLTAHFEHTVALTASGPRILTPWPEECLRKSSPR